MSTKWNITLKIYRQKEGVAPHYDTFKMEVNPDEYVLDLVERVWAFHDRTLCYAHACHHSTCGACGMRVNDGEKLTCITPVRDVVADGGTLKVDPLRNFPVISDLSVDMGTLYTRMDKVGHHSVVELSKEPAEDLDRIIASKDPVEDEEIFRLSDCIECGLCISACPIATTTSDYLGPAVLAGAYQHGVKGNKNLLAFVDSAGGVWRCHHAFECNEVCPSNVDPGSKIMELRKQVIGERFRGIFRG